MNSNYVIWTHYLDKKKNHCVLEDLDNVDDDFELKKGVPRLNGFPDNAVYNFDPEYPKNIVLSDNLFNINRLIVASKSLKEFIESKNPKNVEFLPVSIINHKGRVADKDFFIIHPIHPQDCLNVKASGGVWSDFIDDEIDEVDRLVIDEDVVDPEVLLFRVKFFYDPIFVRRELADEISAKGFSGVRWIELDQFP